MAASRRRRIRIGAASSRVDEDHIHLYPRVLSKEVLFLFIILTFEFMKTPEIPIGIPTNRNTAKDIGPLREALELNSSNGTLRSRYVPDAFFRSLRMQDIARFVRKGIFPLGILGDDMACEENLEIPGWSPKILEQAQRLLAAGRSESTAPEPYLFYPKNRVFQLNLGDPTFMTLFTRPDVRERMRFPYELLRAGKIATSYPNLARKALRYSNLLQPVGTENFDGQIESIVAIGDDPGVVGGLDVSRTGESIRKLGLSSYGSVMESRVGLWQSPRSPRFQSETINQVSDVIATLMERLKDFII